METYEIEVTDETLADLRSVDPLLDAAADIIEARTAGDLLDAIAALRDLDVRTVEYAKNATGRLHREAGGSS